MIKTKETQTAEKFPLSDDQLILLLTEKNQRGSKIAEIFGQLTEKSPIISPIEVAHVLSSVLDLDQIGSDRVKAELIKLMKQLVGLLDAEGRPRSGAYLYFDVDNTIYITSKLKAEMLELLKNVFINFGITAADFTDAYQTYYHDFGSKRFLPEQCVARIESNLSAKMKTRHSGEPQSPSEFTLPRAQKDVVIQALYALARNQKFVDPEAVAMLQALQAKFGDGDRLVAFTNGYISWQVPKVIAITRAMGIKRPKLDALIAIDKTTDPQLLPRLINNSCVLDDQIYNLLKLAETKKDSGLKMFWYNPEDKPIPSDAMEKARRLKLKIIEIHSIREMEAYLLD